MILVSTTELISSVAQHMIQLLALLCMLLIATVYIRSTSLLRSLGLAFVAGVGLAYIGQLAYGAILPGLLSDIRAYLTLLVTLILVLLYLRMVQTYMEHKQVSFPAELTRLSENIRRLAANPIPLWVMLLIGFLIGMIEPIFYGQQQQLLTNELLLSISLPAILLLLAAVATTLAPLFITLVIATKLVPRIRKQEISTNTRQALSLISATGLIIVSWLLVLVAHSFL